MGNCLMTKLKEVVNNPSLLKINEIQLVGSDTEYARLYAAYTTPTFISVVGSGELFEDNSGTRGNSIGTSTTFQGYKGVFISPGATLSVSDKRNFELFQMQNFKEFDLSLLKYTNTIQITMTSPAILTKFADLPSTIKRIQLYGTSVTASDFESINSALVSLNLSNVSSKLNFIAIGAKTALQTLELGGEFSNTTGKIEDIATCTALTRLNFPYAGNSATGITGSIVTLLNNMAQNRTSGIMRLVPNSMVTLPTGMVAAHAYDVKFGSSMVNPTQEETAQGWQFVNA